MAERQTHNNYKKMREQAGLTQAQAAAALLVDRSAISQWETDKNDPTVNNLRNMAALYNCTMSQLLGEA